LRDDPDFPSGRVSLYVCPECADLGCGAVAVRTRRTESVVVWSDFELEYNYHPSPGYDGEFADLGPFEFDWVDHESAVRGAHGIGGFEPGHSV
jgi:hypothetical protein